MQNRYVIGLVALVLWIACLRVSAQDDCLDYYDCHETQYKTSWACTVEWQWLSPDDEYTFPLIIVTQEGDYTVEDYEETCEQPDDDVPEYTDDRIDWHSFSAAIYAGDNGAEIYCLDNEGNGQLGISLTAETPTATDFGCGTFHLLPDTCEYQLNLDDGVTLIADNLWFIGAYYGGGDTYGAVDDSCTMAVDTGAGISTNDSDGIISDFG